jgi:acetyl esterase/lipase
MHQAWYVFAAALILAATSNSSFAQRLSPAAAREKIEVQADVKYGQAGERSLKLDVIKPKAASEKPRACVVWIHGGGWQNGNKSSGVGRLAGLVATGDYVGVSVGYRLTDEATWPGRFTIAKQPFAGFARMRKRLASIPTRSASGARRRAGIS